MAVQELRNAYSTAARVGQMRRPLCAPARRLWTGRHLAEIVRSLSTSRTETDAFGPLEVDGSKLWGAQTQRSIVNFPIGGPESKMPLQVIHAFGVLKKCAAKYNMKYATARLPYLIQARYAK